MNPTRLFFLVVAGCCLLRPAPLPAQDALWGQGKPYSADLVGTTSKGQNITQMLYSDSGKTRTETSMHGMQMVTIIRPDLQKVYQVMVTQKMVMEMPCDPNSSKKQMVTASGPQGKFELIGLDKVEGVACTKYKVTSDKENKVFFFWVDATTKAPVKIMAQDNSFTILWKNYKAGPQDNSLFEPPADYKVMTLPDTSGGNGQ